MDRSNSESDKKLIWATTRSFLEAYNHKHTRSGGNVLRFWPIFHWLLGIFAKLLKAAGWYQKGFLNAQNIVLNEVDFYFPDLPKTFDGYKILHLSDLHLDGMPRLGENISRVVSNLEADLCVMTGDYRNETHGTFQHILPPLKEIVDSVRHKDGIIGTLGNHDTYLMVEEFEKLGMKMLVNQSIELSKGEDKLILTGTDDPHYYYTDQTSAALEEHKSGFKIGLIHSPELYDIAQKLDYRLYLCGHSHGGQICLPNQKPIFTHLDNGQEFYRGKWQSGKLQGYTNQGCGTSGIPIRFNTESEVALITLRKK